jgi:hypothetical protein
MTCDEYTSIIDNRPTARAKQILSDLLLPAVVSAEMLNLRLLSLQYVFICNDYTFINCYQFFCLNIVPADLFDCVINCFYYDDNSDFDNLLCLLSDLFVSVVKNNHQFDTCKIESVHNVINAYVINPDLIALLTSFNKIFCEPTYKKSLLDDLL